jgi:hypothetical protein
MFYKIDIILDIGIFFKFYQDFPMRTPGTKNLFFASFRSIYYSGAPSGTQVHWHPSC